MATWAQISQAEVDACVSAGVAPRSSPHPIDVVDPPTVVCGYPDTLSFDTTFARGADTATFDLYVVAGRTTERSAWQVISAAIDGATGVKQTLDGNLGGLIDSQRVVDMRVMGIEIGGVTYAAAVFSVEVVF